MAETSKITPVHSTAATKEPVLPNLEVTDVNKEINDPSFIAALPSGEAAVVIEGSKVVKINKTGHTVKVLYNCNSCYNIGGLILLGNYLYAVHYNGTIAKIHPHTGQVYQIPNVDRVTYHCSLWFNPSEIPNTDILLLTDTDEGEVFSYNLSSGEKQVHVTGLSGPSCVSYIFSHGSTRYIVTDGDRHMINIYNSSWGIESQFGGYGSGDGKLIEPYAAIMSSNNYIMVSDKYNYRISKFTTKGEFLQHLKTDIIEPDTLSYFEPYLWVRYYTEDFNYGLYRYSLDQ